MTTRAKTVPKPKPGSRKRAATLTTAKKKALFLMALAKSGNVSKAAAATKSHRVTVYKWREDDVEFAGRWDMIIEGLVDKAEAKLLELGADGYLEPVYFQGRVVGHVRKYDTAALIFFLKCNREKYRPAQKIAPTDPTGEQPAVIKVVYES